MSSQVSLQELLNSPFGGTGLGALREVLREPSGTKKKKESLSALVSVFSSLVDEFSSNAKRLVPGIANSAVNALKKNAETHPFSPKQVEVPRVGLVTLREAETGDKRRVLTLFRQVGVTESNIDTKMDHQDSLCFLNTGGIFKPLNDKEFDARLWDRRDVVLVATIESNRGIQVVGYYSLGTDTHFLPAVSHNVLRKEAIDTDSSHAALLKDLDCWEDFDPSEPVWQRQFQQSLRYSSVTGGGIDILVHPDYQGKGLMQLLKLAMFKHLQESHGKIFSICSVATISSADNKDSGTQLQNIPNNRSHHVNGKVGGRPIGTLPARHFEIGAWEILLNLHVYLSEFSCAIPILEKSLLKYNINPSQV